MRKKQRFLLFYGQTNGYIRKNFRFIYEETCYRIIGGCNIDIRKFLLKD